MTNKCKHGYELGPGNRCVKKKGKGSGNTAEKAEIVGRTLAAILTWGGSEALIRADKKAKADEKAKEDAKAKEDK